MNYLMFDLKQAQLCLILQLGAEVQTDHYWDIGHVLRVLGGWSGPSVTDIVLI